MKKENEKLVDQVEETKIEETKEETSTEDKQEESEIQVPEIPKIIIKNIPAYEAKKKISISKRSIVELSVIGVMLITFIISMVIIVSYIKDLKNENREMKESIDQIASQTDADGELIQDQINYLEEIQDKLDNHDKDIDELNDNIDKQNDKFDDIDQQIEDIKVSKEKKKQQYLASRSYTPKTTYVQNTDGLTASAGVNYYGEQKETYYNLNMSRVVANAQNNGLQGDYWVREDGAKMFGDYVIVAANQDVHPYGSTVETSLGEGIVLDTGGFAAGNPTQVDIATDW